MRQSGLLTCAKYAFQPNKLQYCGPLQSVKIQSYLQESQTDEMLSEVLGSFDTMYPYLQFIADANNIANPYDTRVVDAYWIGNSLLNTPSQKSLYHHFMDTLQLNKRVSPNELKWIVSKIPQGALAHHTFHVFNIFTRTGHHTVKHTIETMNSCRIGWGVVKSIKNTKVALLTSSLILRNGMLDLDVPKIVSISIPQWMHILPGQIGSIFTYHWGTLCEEISVSQSKSLDHYTHSAMRLANLTL